MNITVYGKDERTAFAAELLKNELPPFACNIILFPTPTTRDGAHVTDTADELIPIFTSARAGCRIFGYGIPKPLIGIANRLNASVYDLSEDEVLLEENARLTALGTVSKILSAGTADPDALKVGIIGFGRIGKHLTRMLTFHGATLFVFTSKPTLADELRTVGICGVITEVLSDSYGKEILKGLDVLINTAPAKLLTDDMAESLANVKVIELASGSNIPASVKHENMPSVPGRAYPKSAGRILYKRILHCLRAENSPSAAAD